MCAKLRKSIRAPRGARVSSVCGCRNFTCAGTPGYAPTEKDIIGEGREIRICRAAPTERVWRVEQKPKILLTFTRSSAEIVRHCRKFTSIISLSAIVLSVSSEIAHMHARTHVRTQNRRSIVLTRRKSERN